MAILPISLPNFYGEEFRKCIACLLVGAKEEGEDLFWIEENRDGRDEFSGFF